MGRIRMRDGQPSVSHAFARLAGALTLLVAACAARAEQLPIKTYTTADGLASDRVSRIVSDPRGPLWFCTEHGLSRFDGYTFTNYTTAQGLPDNWVDDLLITRAGQYWVATEGGLCRFDPNAASGPLFVTHRPPGQDARDLRVKVLFEDRAGAIWCGTWKSLYRLEVAGDQVKFHYVELGMPRDGPTIIRNLVEDRRGNLWVTSDTGLYRLSPDGRVSRYTRLHGLPEERLLGLLEDREGRLWVGTRHGGLCLIAPDPGPNQPVVARRFTSRDGLSCDSIAALFQSPGGRLWVGTDCGLSEALPAVNNTGVTFRDYASTAALNNLTIWCLAEDKDGNLWVGSPGGAIKIALRGLTTYTSADGLSGNDVFQVFETQAGELLVNTDSPDGRGLNEFDGQRFTPINPVVPGAHRALQDRAGEWWVTTPAGLYRFPKGNRLRDLARIRPRARYASRNGLPGNEIHNLYEDSRGDLWVGIPSRPRGLTRWERATGRFYNYLQADGLPLVNDNAVIAFCDDRAGNLWLGFNDGGLARYRDGRFQVFTTADGVPAGAIRALFVDHDGRLWVASSQGGVGRLDDVTAQRPAFVALTTAEGLSSNDAWCITDDAQGRIYIGTTRGLDRLDPETNRIRHYTTADGLANQTVNVAYRDRHGALWFGTRTGLTRMLPEPEGVRTPPPVMISGLRVGGETLPLAALGVDHAGEFEFGPHQNSISVDFLAINFGAPLRYQHKLEGIKGDWSTPAFERTVHYASLSPGTYRFLARAVNADGSASPHPATVTFTIMPPVWQRWWFLTLSALLVMLLLYGAHRYRLTRLLELERVRTRIAADLHDDIGASLSQIAILNEVLRKQLGADEARVSKTLALMGRVSQEALDSISDIVWAINPRQDHLSDLTRKMRRFASEILPGRNIEFDFQTSGVYEVIINLTKGCGVSSVKHPHEPTSILMSSNDR
ncbi:MAG TPA: two-component regulator propeller domain-containing protein [Blastocatellia bacterium]|nr:two-component regulator propeller domain-containing protein [Blastocatellia bacterium]